MNDTACDAKKVHAEMTKAIDAGRHPMPEKHDAGMGEKKGDKKPMK